MPVATITYAMERPEGLRRDLLHCYDLELPEDFRPHAADGEVEAFELWPIEHVMHAVRDTQAFNFARAAAADSLNDIELIEPMSIMIGDYLRARLPDKQ